MNKDASKKIKEIAGSCIAVRVRVLNRIISSVYDNALSRHGLKISQMNILITVSVYGPATSQMICGMLHMDSSTFSRSVKILKQNGFLKSIPTGEGKIQNIAVTEKGKEKADSIYPDWLKAQKEVEKILGEKVSETLIATGNKLILDGMAK